MISSILNPKIYVNTSKIDKNGLFAKDFIFAGEIVYIKGGHLLSRDDVYSSSTINSYLPISDDYVLGAITAEEEEYVKLYCNHSCCPNCGLHGEITFVAIRDIFPGEELTIDYAFVDNEDYSFECHCGSSECRHIITGFDWKIKRLQDAYYPFFAQYLKDKIDKIRTQQTISNRKLIE